jgi:hypothetical protein
MVFTSLPSCRNILPSYWNPGDEGWFRPRQEVQSRIVEGGELAWDVD